MNNIRHWTLFFVLGILFVLLIIFLTLWPHPPKELSLQFSDKIAHFLAYNFLMLWFCNLFYKKHERIVLLSYFIAQGILLEFMQEYGGFRQFELGDMIANGLGVIIAYLFALTPLQFTLHFIEKWLLISR